MSLRVAVWNASGRSPVPRGAGGLPPNSRWPDPDIICLTEGFAGLMPDGGPCLRAAAGHTRPRVLAGSVVEPLSDARVAPEGHPDLPHQSWVSATLDTPVGELNRRVRRHPLVGLTGDAVRRHEGTVAGTHGVPRAASRDSSRGCGSAGPLWWPATTTSSFRRPGAAKGGGRAGLGPHGTDHRHHGCGLPGRSRVDRSPRAHADLAATGHRTWGGRDHEDRPMSDHSGVVVELQRG